MNREALRANLGALVADTLPKNAQHIDCTFFDDQLPHNVFAMRFDPCPVEGRVVALTDEAIIVKIGRAAFAAIDRAFATQCPSIGTTVRVTPYFRRNFAGERLEAPRRENWTDAQGQTHGMRVMTTGGHITRIPLSAKPTCPYLADLVEQLEIMRTPDSLRTIANMLVDAKAEAIEIVDPAEEHLSDTPPEISFAVATEKFTGRVAVLYDDGTMSYAVELRAAGAMAERIANVKVTRRAEVRADRIDDGNWRRLHVEMLDAGSVAQGSVSQ